MSFPESLQALAYSTPIYTSINFRKRSFLAINLPELELSNRKGAQFASPGFRHSLCKVGPLPRDNRLERLSNHKSAVQTTA